MADVNYIPSVALTETVSQVLIYHLEFSLDKEKTVVFAVSSGGETQAETPIRWPPHAKS